LILVADAPDEEPAVPAAGDDGTDRSDPNGTPQRRRRWPVVLGAVLALVVIWFGFAAIRLAGAAADAKDGTRSMQKAKRHTTGSLTNFVESVGAADPPRYERSARSSRRQPTRSRPPAPLPTPRSSPRSRSYRSSVDRCVPCRS